MCGPPCGPGSRAGEEEGEGRSSTSLPRLCAPRSLLGKSVLVSPKPPCFPGDSALVEGGEETFDPWPLLSYHEESTLAARLPESQMKACCPWLWELSLASASGDREETPSCPYLLPLGPSPGDVGVLCPGFSSQRQDRPSVQWAAPSQCPGAWGSHMVGEAWGQLLSTTLPASCLPGTWVGGAWGRPGALLGELLTLVAHPAPLLPCFTEQGYVYRGQGPLWNVICVSNCVHFYLPSPPPLHPPPSPSHAFVPVSPHTPPSPGAWPTPTLTAFTSLAPHGWLPGAPRP